MYDTKLVDKERGFRYWRELEIYHNGKLMASYSDGGEPEDQSFYRDWSWVTEELKRAYKLGFEDGEDSTEDRIHEELKYGG